MTPRAHLFAALCALALLRAPVVLAAPDAAPTAASPAQVTLRPQGYGWILADSKGMSLYTYLKDTPGGPSTCVGECAKTWKPLAAPDDATAFGEWTIVQRANNAHQWAFRGKPLYTSSRDVAPGDQNGDETFQQWFLAVKYVTTPQGFSIAKTAHGHLLVDQKRMTLYVSKADSANASKCADACARLWQPVEAWQLAATTEADWSILKRADGTRQWAYKGKPLYRYANDFGPTEISGDQVDGHSIVVLQPPPPNPPWITYHESDGGVVLADAAGKTLYALDLSRPPAFVIGFAKPMDAAHNWTPVTAAADAQPVGFWSIIKGQDGTPQWAYQNMPLYTNNRDKEPGDLNGVRRMDWYWRTIMKNGQTLPGSGI
jgi:predicted lipoprotein with Yx(FWY)xxD motif